MICRLRFGLVVVAYACSFVFPASAAPGPAKAVPAAAADASAVADHVRRGDKARGAGRWADAVAAYRDALEAAERAGLPLEQRAAILGELGLIELVLGKHRDAAEHLDTSLTHHGALSRDQRWRYEQGQKKAEREVVKLYLGVDPPDAEVLVDGAPIKGRKPSYLVFLDPGPHALRARLAGYADDDASIDASKGTSQTITLSLQRLTPPRSSAAVIRLREPTPAPAAPPSNIATTLRKAGFITVGAGAVAGLGLAVAGELLDDHVEARSSALTKRAGFNACLGTTHQAECNALHSAARARDVVDRLAVGSFALSAAVGVVALSSFWWAPGEQRPARIQVKAAVTPNAASATVTGGW